MDVLEIKGKVNTALCYTKVVEDEAIEQIRRMCDYEFTEGSKIRIMPDVHSGKGCTIGTTMTIKDKAVPNIVGVDIGCGMLTINLGKGNIVLFVKLYESTFFTLFAPIIYKFLIIMQILCSQFFRLFSTSRNSCIYNSKTNTIS